MGKLEENLEKNEHLSEEFKKLARQSFQEMFDMLGREGFKKWVRLQTISKDVKTLIYEWADSEEMDEDKKSGDYCPSENKIRITNGLVSPKEILGVSKHEGFHFFTRHGDLRWLSTYLNEGVTEYLKHLTEEADEPYCYPENVEVVTFLREFMGDSIIQTYLEGKKKYFLNDLHDILKEEIKTEDEREEEIYEFLDCLDERHSYLRGEEEFYEEEEVDHTAEKINNFFRKIILCKFRQMAKSREFNKNGQVDEELAKTVIKEKLKNVRFVGLEYDYYGTKEDISNFIIETMMDNILYEIRENCNPKVKVNSYCEGKKELCEYGIFSVNEIYSKIFDSKENMSKITFCDYLIKISSELSLPQAEMKELCKKYDVEEIYGMITNNMSRNLAVFNLLSKEITSTESQFRKIGDSEYVEQKDGQFVYLKISDDGTIHEETDLSKVKDIFKIDNTLESIRLVNREDDYKNLGVFDEQKFQQVEMVYQMTNQILYQENVDLEDVVKNMNVLIEDSQFLSQITEISLQKRTRLQVMDLINVLTKEELEQVSNEIYDEAILNSGIKDIEQEEELKEFYKRLYEYEIKEKDSR